MKKVVIGRRIFTVVDTDIYNQYPQRYNPKFTAVPVCNNQYVLPINSKPNDSTPGVYFYPNGMVGVVTKPTDYTNYLYSNVIDWGNAKTVNDIIQYNDMLRNIQDDLMATSENVLKLPIYEEDTPAMRTLKMAINAKGVDKKEYEDRFPQFQNDMRLLRGHTITLAKLISICAAFDITLQLTLADKPGVPNPIGTEYVVDLTIDRLEVIQ